MHDSRLSVEEYHNLSDTTMDSLLESLEELLDSIANPNFEVEYHVCSLMIIWRLLIKR